jgi:hypothetical protein
MFAVRFTSRPVIIMNSKSEHTSIHMVIVNIFYNCFCYTQSTLYKYMQK